MNEGIDQEAVRRDDAFVLGQRHSGADRFDAARVVERLVGADIDAEVVAIDVPLDLPETTIGRPAEAEARRRLGERRSSVFSSLPAELYSAD